MAAVPAPVRCCSRAAALGTAFLCCPEAGTAPVRREALHRSAPTAMTRAFTGRAAHGIRNQLLDEHTTDAPAAYPGVHHLTAPLRQAGRTRGEADLVNLWAGQSYPLVRDLPAANLVRRIDAETRAALQTALSAVNRSAPRPQKSRRAQPAAAQCRAGGAVRSDHCRRERPSLRGRAD
ncbi:nitronate monooxygenase [Streptomyces puniciscabiei]